MFTLDGNIVDIAAITSGVIAPVAKTTFKGAKRLVAAAFPDHFTTPPLTISKEQILTDALNGAMIVPFGMMVLSVFSSDMMRLLTESSKLTIALGGFAGLIFIFAELVKD